MAGKAKFIVRRMQDLEDMETRKLGKWHFETEKEALAFFNLRVSELKGRGGLAGEYFTFSIEAELINLSGEGSSSF